MADKQFKTFQDQQVSPKNKEKTQRFVPFNPPCRIKVSDIKFVQYDQEYLKTVTSDQQKSNWKKGLQDFSINGLTKDDALLICKEHNKIAQTLRKQSIL